MLHNLTRITWDSFATFNQDASGIRFKFEDLCRQLFVNEFLALNTNFRYLHANSNNPGLETDPVYCERDKRRIGFQAKYFDGNPGYEQIYKSAQEIIRNYKGKVDRVYLYTNRDLNTRACKFMDTEKILNDAGIELELITNNQILDLVRKYPYLAMYYFGQHSISHDWFIKAACYRYDDLGERYNSKFNVTTTAYRKLSLFCIDESALYYINKKKQKLLNEISDLRQRYDYEKYSEYFRKLEQCVLSLSEVDCNTICDSFEWKGRVESAVSTELKGFAEDEQHFEDEEQKEYEERSKGGSEDRENDSENRQRLQYRAAERRRNIKALSTLIQLPSLVEVSKEEQDLIERDVLIITGNAGCGKSHLLAHETSVLLNESECSIGAAHETTKNSNNHRNEHSSNHREALLLVAGNFLNNDPVSSQIMESLKLDYSFDELIDILEAIGEREQRVIPVFIDALNETWKRELWKNGLNSIIDKINDSHMVKLALSFRTEYEGLLLSDSMKQRIQNGEIIRLVHKGFTDTGMEAIRKFFNYYNISFTPSEYFRNELTNPLFLTLYCKTYDGEEVDLPTLYERVIDQINKKLFNSDIRRALDNSGYSEDNDIVRPFIRELTSYFIDNNRSSIRKEELENLSFWNKYRLAPAPFISQLGKEHFLYDNKFENTTVYHFAYDQMNDYYCAEAVMERCIEEAKKKYQEEISHSQEGTERNAPRSGNRGLKKEDYEKKTVREYLTNDLLNIQDGVIRNYGKEDVFVNVCALYAERFHEECIDIIENLKVEDVSEATNFYQRYLSSFSWRKACTVDYDELFRHLSAYLLTKRCIDALWQMFIGNSVKLLNPLNADGLHRLLYGMKLAKRDALWTININDLMADESDRLSQMIYMYVRGEKIEFRDEDQIRLFLVLLGWLLTSSDRRLRDYTSKAMVEILKDHFELCRILLTKFEGVNDPYVISRLYGIVYGACCKRDGAWNRTAEDEANYQSLAEYVYKTVFNQESVYPDILLRDYARNIIERFLYENPDNVSFQRAIDPEKIRPPYHSEPIPDIDGQKYALRNYDGGMFYLMHSMNFEGMGMYGDFGRYVFQNAIHDFDVDEKKIHDYAIHFILNDLGYNNELFDEYDRKVSFSNYDRETTVKTERIGKKYQWIAMYNILARVSDHAKMIDRYNWPEPCQISYEGTWEPDVRDFDPTVNQNYMQCPDAPRFTAFESFQMAARKENVEKEINSRSDIKAQSVWLAEEGNFYRDIQKTFVLQDDDGNDWVSMTRYFDTGRDNMKESELFIWSWINAFFVTEKQYDLIKKCFEKGIQIATEGSQASHQSYFIFSREYPWASSCVDFEKEAWQELNIKTGETKTEPKKVMEPDIDAYKKILVKLGLLEGDPGYVDLDGVDIEYDDEGIPKVPGRIVEYLEKKEVKVGRVLIADTDLLWGGQYDASRDKDLSWKVPCGKIIRDLGLRQQTFDGFYYDEDGKLAAFDTDFVQGSKSAHGKSDQSVSGVVVRRDLLEKFLRDNGMRLIWIVKSEKEIHFPSEYWTCQWSDWQGLFVYHAAKAEGEMRFLKIGGRGEF